MSARAGLVSMPRITTQHMKSFSRTCLEWAWHMRNASDRQVVVTVARDWLNVARALDRRVASGGEPADDLRSKLN